MNAFELLIELAAQYGFLGLAIAAAILIAVFIARKSGLVATPDHARIANVLLGAIFAGLSDNPQNEQALLAVLSSVLAGLVWEGLQFAGKKLDKPA